MYVYGVELYVVVLFVFVRLFVCMRLFVGIVIFVFILPLLLFLLLLFSNEGTKNKTFAQKCMNVIMCAGYTSDFASMNDLTRLNRKNTFHF